MSRPRPLLPFFAALLTSSACQPYEDIVVCEPRPAGEARVCTVEAGSDETRIRGDILAPDTVYVGGALRIDATGHIACVGCDCDDEGPAPTEISCPGAAVSPGLINLHEHLTFANGRPAADGGERYEHRHDWRLGLHGHAPLAVSGGNATAAEQAWGELRHLLAGTTSVAGAGGVAGLLRNVDSLVEPGSAVPFVFTDTFPLSDPGGEQRSESCDYPAIQSPAFAGLFETYAPHLAEGIDAYARNEFLCTRSSAGGGADLLEANTTLIHGVSHGPADFAEMAEEGASLVWSPRSNTRLYGDTARASVAASVGVNVALGTDWVVSGSMNLQRELVCAAEWSARSGDPFEADDLWRMVTSSAARAAAAEAAIGELREGLLADVAVFASAPGRRTHRAATTASPEDTLLVLREGRVLFGDAAVVAALSDATCDALDVCGEARAVCTEAEIGQTLADLQGAVGAAYPLFFCGPPDDEPSCHPARASSVNGALPYSGVPDFPDWDGDGRSGIEDSCPFVFDPIRPVDAGAPADADGDGLGDACDHCPLDPDLGRVLWPLRVFFGGDAAACAAL